MVRDFNIPGPAGRVSLRLYRPGNGTSFPVVLYLHGGGFVSGTLDDADVPAQFIATHCQALVLSVDYALAPMRPFPAAIEDAYTALEAAGRMTAVGADPRRLAVVGDDAGGNLAACLSLVARDRNAVSIAAQVLIGPMLDPSMTRLNQSVRQKSDTTAEGCADCYRQYLPQAMQRLHPYAAPLESRRLRGLPPAYIATAEYDVLHNEAEKYAAALIDAGVPTQVARFPGVRHAELRTHQPLLAEVADFLRRRLRAEAAVSSSRPYR